jgi:hypothetical protein
MSRITSADLKELQGLIAFKACETFVYQKGESKRKKVLQQELGQIFHGDARSNIASYASLAFEGQSPFHGLFETVETSSGRERHIPSSFTRNASSNLVAGQSFSLQVLKQATLGARSAARPITSLSLWNRVKEVHKNCKKAMAFAKEKLKPDGSFASGTNNADDLWNHVLDKMYEYTSSNDVADVENNDEDDPDDDEEEAGDNDAPGDAPPAAPGTRPPTWYFRGFWTFQLFGPLVPVEDKSALFNVDSLDDLVQGRASIRAENAKSKRAGASNSQPRDSSIVDLTSADSPSGFKRGMTNKEKSAIVHLAQQQAAARARADELEFETISKSMDFVKDELNIALAIVRQLGIDDKEDDNWKRVFELQKKMREKNRELSDFQERKRQKREEEGRNGSIFDNLLQSVNRKYSMPSSVFTVAPSAQSASSSSDVSANSPDGSAQYR